MENKEFRVRLKELRKQAGLSQRQLADKVGVNFSYLSKIESGAMPPPSEQVILRLAEVLDADKDELLTLAGKIPSDIAQILKSREALQILRSDRTQKKIKKVNKKEGTGMMKSLLNYKRLSKIAVPIVLVCAVAASLWFASPLPARALDITITPPATGTHGNAHSFSVTVDITSTELVPIQAVNMVIYNVSNPGAYTVTCNNLPLTDGGTASYSSSGGVVTVTASSPNDTWAYFLGTGYANWEGTGYDFGTTFGYGYATGASRMTYSGTWTSPSNWPGGDYQVKISIVAQSPTLSATFVKNSSSFTLNAVTSVTDESTGGGSTVVSPGIVNVTNVVTKEGRFIKAVTVQSKDKDIKLSIPKNTNGKTAKGKALHTISVIPMTAPPDPPEDANIIGLTYDIGPDGATFEPAITLTFTYDPDEVTDVDSLKIAMWDKATKAWVTLEDYEVHPETNTITALVSHFTAFSVIEIAPVEEEEAVIEEEEVVVEEEEEVVVEEEEEVVVEEEEEEVVEEEEEVVVIEEEEVVEEEEEEVVTPTGIAWWVWVIIGAAVVVVGLLVYFLWWRRRLA